MNKQSWNCFNKTKDVWNCCFWFLKSWDSFILWVFKQYYCMFLKVLITFVANKNYSIGNKAWWTWVELDRMLGSTGGSFEWELCMTTTRKERMKWAFVNMQSLKMWRSGMEDGLSTKFLSLRCLFNFKTFIDQVLDTCIIFQPNCFYFPNSLSIKSLYIKKHYV